MTRRVLVSAVFAAAACATPPPAPPTSSNVGCPKQRPINDESCAIFKVPLDVCRNYFELVKGAVAENWDPTKVLRKADPTGQLYRNQVRLTRLRIAIDQQTVTDVQVEKSCGLNFLDAAAVLAVEKAQPLPPPPELREGAVLSFTFGLCVEIG